MNLSNYIQESRVHRAYDLLISTDLSVEAISHQAGYHNIGFFIKNSNKYMVQHLIIYVKIL